MQVRGALTGSGLARADAEVLLARALRRDRAWLLAHDDYALTPDEWTRYGEWVQRRRKDEPVAYITGAQEFYGRPFLVDRRVLVPRPSTEGLVQAALAFLRDGKDTTQEVDEGIIITARRTTLPFHDVTLLADVGTGSGCAAITLALERPDLRVIATDVSAEALEVAAENAKRLGVSDRVNFRQGDGAKPLLDIAEPFVLVTNPPYIPSGRTLMRDVVDHEPHVALFGGPDGTDLILRLRRDAAAHPFCLGVVMECGTEQAP